MPVSYQDINGNNRGNSGDLKTEDFIDQVKIEVTTMPMDDGGRSQQIASRKMTPERSSDINDPNYESVLHANNIFQRHEIDLYNKIIELLNLKKLDNGIIEELNRDLITKYIDKIIVYEEEKVDVILKYERELIK